MKMADAAMEESGTILDADADPGVESYPENMCISLDNFFAILDEPPLQPEHEHGPLLPGTAEGFQEDDLARCQFNHVKDFQLHAASTGIPEDVIEQGYSPWDTSNYCVASDCEREMSSGFLFGSEGSSNKFNDMYSPLLVDNGNLHASQCTESRGTLLSDHSSDWLRLSYGNGSCSLDSFGASSSGTRLSGNFDHLRLRNNVRKCSAPSVSVDQAGCMYSSYPYINDCYMDGEKKEGFGQMEGEIVFQPVQRVSKQDVNNISSLCTLQNGESGSVPHSTEQVGNVYPSLSLCSSIDPNAAVQKVNAYGATDVTCDVNNSCLTLPRECFGDAEIAFDFSGQFYQQYFSNEHEELNHRKDERGNKLLLSQNSYGRCEVKLGIQKESPDSFLPEVSAIELDVPLPDILQTEQNSEDMSFISESSTDSSPVPSSRNSTSDNIDQDVANKSKPLVLDLKLFPSNKQKPLTNYGRAEQFLASHHQKNNVSSGGGVSIGKNSSINSLSVEDDFDICILDDISDPVRSSPPLVPARASTPLIPAKSHLISQHSGCTDPHYSGSGVMRLKPDDERLTYRIALQDLSQPKSEASPPDGVLAVPLLRHQRIALSWMVQKEIASPHCCGGILADDQGLGKTISTIALILTERSPSSRSCSLIKKQDEFEPLNLDDDDEVNVTKHPRNSSPVILSGSVKLENTAMVVKGRPAAGTLVVCPTSVLRQWAEELQNKVTSKGNLSVLVYHGSNRTKDPNELAKYDVVLTTYAIVSMEVPKQPLVDKDDEEKGKVDALGLSIEPLTGKKRKESSSSNTNNRKNRNMMDGALLESAARPLARVGWFRVVLDEAQSIKNYRTQVARACWGLRAKRRWCLSGTPIQNAVDDLYSYFRFLRYDPYAVYKSFCSTIKIPINRNPTNGYKKLQAVLKTVMLRRTKGTLLDGKPIITLPPKTVRLKKVDFSKEERTYYARLEAESREQFKVYADAGTVKENYVNILLMLLRLRQACDHPLLVRGFDSNSIWRSSLEMAKKLPGDKQMDLLRCLEASVAICTICNDAPEDAVVTICGHVFCNQCIFEHLTGDESICPLASCKVQLSAASVFSKGTLKSSLSAQSGHDCSGSDPGMVNKPKIYEGGLFSDSSKIKAAIEILQSLPRSGCSLDSDFQTYKGEANGLGNGVDTVPQGGSAEVHDQGHLYSDKCSNGQVTEKAIVFSQWTRMLDLLEVPLKGSFIQYRRLDGTMSVAAREKAVKEFNTLPEVTVMIMSLKAASLGLNMVAACHVILLDLWWNPTTEDQAIDRAHRIGQTRPVTVSRLTVEGTVEDRILALQERKREMVASAFGEDESGSRQTRLTVEDLKYLFMV